MKKLVFSALVVPLISGIVIASEGKKDWKFHSELSYVKTSGNSKAETFAAKAEATKTVEKNRFTAKASGLYAKSDGSETASRWYILGRWDRTITDRMFWFLQGDLLNDKFAGFQYRTVWLGGVGYDILKTKKHYLKGLASIGYAYQKYEAGGSDNYPTASIDLNYVWQILDNLKFKEDFNYQTSLSDMELFYVNSDTSLQVKINTHFSLGVGLRIAYQNTPPAENIKKTDTTFLTSLIIDY